ncbi:MAG: hypothetical protein AW09_002515 [Candidatus Accumulibacter phosphatis]|uniref:Uncharacterized protein n=1 Tax=Candidatus Accumulibacter phosphatis TaxID=327160 RepID=A0A080LUS2_9PROT|nr:MAG: hypothetical protein AW09_002515 [Candidatus Accumulibacter phosphatis]
MREGIEKGHHRPGARADVRQGHAEHRREHQDLQNVVLGQRVDDAAGYEIQHEVDKSRRLGCADGVGGNGLGIECCRIDVHALPRFNQVDDQQAKRQREGRQHLEIDQCPDTDAAEFLHVFHAGNAQHHSGKDDRREHHLDQLDEDVTKRLQVGSDVGGEDAQNDTGRHADQDLDIEFSEKAANHDVSPSSSEAITGPQL